jgi:hypothetical protein
MRRSLLFLSLLVVLAVLAWHTSFAASSAPPPPDLSNAYDAQCGVPIPANVVVRSLPDAATCSSSLSLKPLPNSSEYPNAILEK